MKRHLSLIISCSVALLSANAFAEVKGQPISLSSADYIVWPETHQNLELEKTPKLVVIPKAIVFNNTVCIEKGGELYAQHEAFFETKSSEGVEHKFNLSKSGGGQNQSPWVCYPKKYFNY